MCHLPGEVIVLRTFGGGDQPRPVWWVFNAEETLKGKVGESKNKLLYRWGKEHPPITRLIRIRGMCRLSEAVATVTYFKRRAREKKLEQKNGIKS